MASPLIRRSGLILFLACSACSVARHRTPLYGPGLASESSSRRALDDRIASVDSQLSGLEPRIAEFDGKIRLFESAAHPANPRLAAQAKDERNQLERQRGALKAQRDALQGERESERGLATTPSF